jgi:Tol biopolymer transport system component
VSSTGEQAPPDTAGDDASYPMAPSISADGRVVQFRSRASNLVPGDTNGVGDTFVHDLVSGRTERVSIASTGEQGNGESTAGATIVHRSQISDDGRFVAFASSASNLVPGDTNGAVDVFVHDRSTRRTTRVSVTSAGDQSTSSADATFDTGRIATAVAISGDGRFVVFDSVAGDLAPGDADASQDVFVHDLERSTTVLVTLTPSGGDSVGGSPAVSADGRVIAFYSTADDLVEDDTNGSADVFVYEPPST